MKKQPENYFDTIPSNVNKYLDECNENLYGDGGFIERVHMNMYDAKMKSPIEMLLYSSLMYLLQLEYDSHNGYGGVSEYDIELYERDNLGNKKRKLFSIDDWICVLPQYPIGSYKADFLIHYRSCILDNTTNKNLYYYVNEVVIECDGHNWHERTEQERRKEKERDRFIQMQGYKVFRYSGKEILENHEDIARNILRYIVGDEQIKTQDV